MALHYQEVATAATTSVCFFASFALFCFPISPWIGSQHFSTEDRKGSEALGEVADAGAIHGSANDVRRQLDKLNRMIRATLHRLQAKA